MEIKTNAHAGTLESSDAFVQVALLDEEAIEVVLESSVEEIYGDDIIELIHTTVEEMGVSRVSIHMQDKGALDFVIKARVQAAILRACECAEPQWGDLL